MRKSNWLLLTIILAILCFTISCQCLKQATDADITSINGLYNQNTLACSTGNVELYLSSFTEDAVVMPPGFPIMIGEEELRSQIKGLFGMFNLELPYTVDNVIVHGDWAYARSSYLYSMSPKEGGETVTIAGKELDVIEKQADGSWKISIQCYNFDAQLKGH